ncbi:transcription antitermination factor NusB [Candidatus Shapirobacteria bacterium CG07_land_8_20_14_0_80_39_12]|uniref:Transcription antitermination factor NusB n=2 Tax=Candidatus Shapironibacteriota TaxID=1752721 RepID=A0A2M6YQ19_9BACT|nr:MAG: transcription antitermination factor NusB [Candidatus Shapirobacteria bacterium CG07_land_8_20_14_0_80_39_12]PJA49775.1 MAG: transcription antitermination factor NusB [Candidatus Shapirobacteria bacterium CG_4_9_14_3_um_filter_39_13]
MKTRFDPRHKKREEVVQDLFAFSFQKENNPQTEIGKKVKKALKKIDETVTGAAPEWPLEQINKVDLAILRLAIWELTIKRKEPPKVIIDEAIELGKTFGSEKSSSFINGVLGTVFKNLK